VQVTFAQDLKNTGAVDLSAFMNARLNSVHVNELQGNPFQPDVNYRGYTASPLLGTPQGLSVYIDGVRLNQPFGDVMSWDLIPKTAILSMALMPGSNPLFGLNTLGGALSMQSKSGLTSPGTAIQSIYGRSMRRAVEFEHGGSRGGALHWYLTGNLFGEDGWRENSPSDLRQLFGKVGWRSAKTDLSLTMAGVDDSLGGNGLQEEEFLGRDYESVYTKPDITDNRATLTNMAVERRVGQTLRISGNAYYRHLRTKTLNGDLNENSLDQAVYQPEAEERAALAAAGYSGFHERGDVREHPAPVLPCINDVLLNEEPAENATASSIERTLQHNAGLPDS
jgi:outer membrane cobalamin receptor